MFIDKTGKYSSRRYCRWKSEINIGSHMDNNTSFPGLYYIHFITGFRYLILKW